MTRLTLAQQLAASLVEQIGNGTYRAGDRLPSLRECMRLFGHSKNTVINAYESLASQGLVEARHGLGFFVRHDAPATHESDDPLPYARAMDTVWLMRQQFVREPGHSPLGEGFPPVDWLMDMRLDKFTRQIMRTGVSTLFRYGNRLGNAGLRQHLVQKLASYSISATPRQIVTTHGGQPCTGPDRAALCCPGRYGAGGRPRLLPPVRQAATARCAHAVSTAFARRAGHPGAGAASAPAQAKAVLHSIGGPQPYRFRYLARRCPSPGATGTGAQFYSGG